MALTSAKVWIKVTANNGTLNYYSYIDKGTDNWGTVVEANEADFISTETIQEGTTSIGSTGWKSFDIDVDDISAETIWFKIAGASEGDTNIRNITFASQNNATAGDRPYIELVWSSGTVTRLLAMTGVGQ